nr:hypothetical protein [Achromobacter ruhlandii]
MMKLPNDPDQFRHFRGDPPDIKLQAWKQMQERLASRDRARIVAWAVVIIFTALVRWGS